MDQTFEVISGLDIGMVALILLGFSSGMSWRSSRLLRVRAVREIGVSLLFTDDGLTVRMLNNSEIALIVAKIELNFLIPDLGATKRIELSKQVGLIQRPELPIRTLEQVGWNDWGNGQGSMPLTENQLAELLGGYREKDALLVAYVWDEIGRRYESNELLLYVKAAAAG